MPPNKTPTRIVVIGSCCAGKTTFWSRLATLLGARHIELDALHWEPNWKEADDSVFKLRLTKALEVDSWVVDGNYTNKIKDVVWPRAEALTWLDPSLLMVLKRFFVRSLTRSFKDELLWGHSKETLRNNIFSRNSLLMWILTTHKSRTEAYLKLMENPPEDITIYRLRTESHVDEFVRQFPKE